MAWTECSEPRPFAAQRLICFPHAGGSSYFFREWRKSLPEFEVHAACYPGRADRFAEPVAVDLMDLAQHLAEAILPLLDRPTVFFGHSMGAVIAYETTRLLEAQGAGPSHLFVSGARAAHLIQPDPRAAAMDDETVVETLVELGGTDTELLDNAMFRELILPYVRGDFRMLGAYGHQAGALLSCPVTAVAGEADPRVTAEQSAQWARLTSGAFHHRMVPGDHFYLAGNPPYALIKEMSAHSGQETTGR